jgi:hypothetical protein
MNEDHRSPPCSDYALDVSVGGSFQQRYPLRLDILTWTGRRPHQSDVDFEYIHIPGSRVRCHCLFEWDAKEEQFWVTTGGAAAVWINGEAVGSQQRRLLRENDVIIVSAESRGPDCVRLTLVRVDA